MWGIDSFDQWGVELGKVMANQLGTPAHLPRRPDTSALDSSTAELVRRFRRAPPAEASVLRLYDARAHGLVEVVPARAGVVSVRTSGRTARDESVVDVLRRVVELRRARLLVDGEDPSQDAVLAPAGPVTTRPPPDADPSAVRLCLLALPYREPVALDRDVLAAAGGRLAGWRTAVAAWAEQPSRRMPPAYVDALRDAWEDDLDTARALAVLERLAADDEVPGGARFETFAWADRVLALELVRDVGR